MFPQTSKPLYELASRENNGIEVTLLWEGAVDGVLLSVRDRLTGEWFVRRIDAADALEAYRHPFAYAGRDPYGGAVSAVA